MSDKTSLVAFETERKNKAKWVRQANKESLSLENWVVKVLNQAASVRLKRSKKQEDAEVK